MDQDMKSKITTRYFDEYYKLVIDNKQGAFGNFLRTHYNDHNNKIGFPLHGIALIVIGAVLGGIGAAAAGPVGLLGGIALGVIQFHVAHLVADGTFNAIFINPLVKEKINQDIADGTLVTRYQAETLHTPTKTSRLLSTLGLDKVFKVAAAPAAVATASASPKPQVRI